MPPAGIAAAVLPALITGGIGAATSLLNKPKGPPELDESRKKTLGSFASRLASEAGNMQNMPSNTFTLGPGSTPIRFSPLKKDFNQPFTFNQ